MTEKGRLAVEPDAARCIALLSVLAGRPVGEAVLRPIEAAAAYWAAGDKALANLRLAFSGLPTLGSQADAARVEAAAWCLDQGLTPRELMKALDPSVLDLKKYNPDHPRVPAGSGRESGRWTDGEDDGRQEGYFVPSSRPDTIHVAANEPFKPGGILATPSEQVDPLDPAGLNEAPPSPEEQKAIADTLNNIANGTPEEVRRLQPHPYRNLPAIPTGAILPADPQGYIAYDVEIENAMSSKGRGASRIILNIAKDSAYYTSNHYFSFYKIDLTK